VLKIDMTEAAITIQEKFATRPQMYDNSLLLPLGARMDAK
jgi:hypothetical protein